MTKAVCEEQLLALESKFGDEETTRWWRGLPKRIRIMTACSGTGMFELCLQRAVEEINSRLAHCDEEEIQVGLSQLFRLQFLQDFLPTPSKSWSRQVSTLFSCENVASKQKFLMDHVLPKQANGVSDWVSV